VLQQFRSVELASPAGTSSGLYPVLEGPLSPSANSIAASTSQGGSTEVPRRCTSNGVIALDVFDTEFSIYFHYVMPEEVKNSSVHYKIV